MILLSSIALAADCSTTCGRTLQCIGVNDPQQVQMCVATCMAGPGNPQLMDAVANAKDCNEVLAVLNGGVAAAGAGAPTPPASLPSTPPASPAPPAQCPSPKGTNANAQLVALLTSSAWCSYSYNGSTESTSRVVFASDGKVTENGGSETVRTGSLSDQYGNQTATYGAWGSQADGSQGCWQVQGQNLMLSQDGRAYSPMPLTVTKNNNGYPILNANGKEYAQCK